MTRVDLATAIAAWINGYYNGQNAAVPATLPRIMPPTCTPEMVLDVANWRMAGMVGVPPHGVLGASADSHLSERWDQYLEAAAAEGAPCGVVPGGPWFVVARSRMVGRRDERGELQTVCLVHVRNNDDAHALATFIAASRDAAEALAGLLAWAEARIKRRDDGMPVDAHHRALDADLQPARRALAKLQGLEA